MNLRALRWALIHQRRRAPARWLRAAALIAAAWVATAAVFVGTPAAGASPRTVATAPRSPVTIVTNAWDAVRFATARVVSAQTHARSAVKYTVRAGDTLSGICGSGWP